MWDSKKTLSVCGKGRQRSPQCSWSPPSSQSPFHSATLLPVCSSLCQSTNVSKDPYAGSETIHTARQLHGTNLTEGKQGTNAKEVQSQS